MLAGFENNAGKSEFNFILSNGMRTAQKSHATMQVYMMPESYREVRKVEIYCWQGIHLDGFKFFDSSNNLIFRVGRTKGQKTKVIIGADE